MNSIINHTRFDLMAKLLYIKYGYYMNIPFYKNLYIAHIETFNNFWEHPGTKTKKEDFIKSFNNLIADMEINRFNNKYPIIIGNNNVLINGSHRLMCSYYFNNNPCIVEENKGGCTVYNYDYFRNRNKYWKRNKNNIYLNLNEQYMDRIALEYMINKKNTIIIYIYPIAYDILYNNKLYDNVLNIIHKYGNLYYTKDIISTEFGLQNIIKELYRGEKWIGGLFPNSTGGKYDLCKSNNKLEQKSTLFIIDMNQLSLKLLIDLKTELRLLFGLYKHSLHIPDSHNDSLRIAKSLLNKNSIDFYNKTNILNIDNNVKEELLKIFNEQDTDNIYIESGLTLPIKIKQITNESSLNEKIICYDSTKHYYINGFKFAIFDS